MRYLIRQFKLWLERLADFLKFITRTGNYWYWLCDDQYQTLEIKDLIYPLRYDILIRKEFFSFYVENHDLYLNDLSAFIEKARCHDYYIWFTKVAILKASLDLRNNPEEVEKAFIRRIKKSAALYDQIKSSGFNRQYPIIPRTGETIMPTTTGRITNKKYFMGDGCHRLACLMSMGYKELPKEFCRIKVYRRFVPLDNTSLLMAEKHTEVDWPEEFVGD